MKSSFDEVLSHIASPADRHILAGLIARNEVLRVRLLVGEVDNRLCAQEGRVQELEKELKKAREYSAEINAWWVRSQPIYETTVAENQRLRTENAVLSRPARASWNWCVRRNCSPRTRSPRCLIRRRWSLAPRKKLMHSGPGRPKRWSGSN